ncbi:MAG: ribose-phosphate pyrophosphokinase [Spirochaetota bacterium]|nr:ribose-phosphate pyrophosphokinase [Spirochaetota bacterium]
MDQRGKIALMCCESGMALGKKIYDRLIRIYEKENEDKEYKPLFVDSEEVWFANGEVKTVVNDNIRGFDLYIIQSMDDPLSKRSTNDNFMALLTAIDAAYQSDVDQITVIMPQYPYSRQERKKARECITAKLVATFLESTQATRVITVDVHSEATVGFFRRVKFENLHASRIIIDHFHRTYPGVPIKVVAPDVGSAARARFFSMQFESDLAIIDKERNYAVPGTIESMRLVGDVKGHNVFMGDDMIATGSTLISGCHLLKDHGANDIYLSCTFPFFNGNAIDKFDKAFEDNIIKKVIGTDCVYRGEQFMKDHPWYEEVTVSRLIGRVIYNINRKLSVSKLLE